MTAPGLHALPDVEERNPMLEQAAQGVALAQYPVALGSPDRPCVLAFPVDITLPEMLALADLLLHVFAQHQQNVAQMAHPPIWTPGGVGV